MMGNKVDPGNNITNKTGTVQCRYDHYIDNMGVRGMVIFS